MATDRPVVLTLFIIALYILQLRGDNVASLSDSLDCYNEKFNFTKKCNISINGQGELDDFVNNLATNDDKDRCIQIFLTGKSVYSLDILKIMRIKLGTGGGLVIIGVTDPQVTITNTSNLEELINTSLVANVSLVVLDGLVFTECPVPVVLEEVSIVIVQNCTFM